MDNKRKPKSTRWARRLARFSTAGEGVQRRNIKRTSSSPVSFPGYYLQDGHAPAFPSTVTLKWEERQPYVVDERTNGLDNTSQNDKEQCESDYETRPNIQTTQQEKMRTDGNGTEVWQQQQQQQQLQQQQQAEDTNGSGSSSGESKEITYLTETERSGTSTPNVGEKEESYQTEKKENEEEEEEEEERSQTDTCGGGVENEEGTQQQQDIQQEDIQQEVQVQGGVVGTEGDDSGRNDQGHTDDTTARRQRTNTNHRAAIPEYVCLFIFGSHFKSLCVCV
ncbi:hypothetical protein Pcinc_025188 [Petrolisthes cinctipes]|uniref:Uncharacterized protein n=1 Tax=Petrolisthes cinctipes TaxID=88211 RepID=A0AAE1KDE0_PETCI|nr:hypothetical protein Pcinc_025188 [Petrolisthes cinctipes]